MLSAIVLPTATFAQAPATATAKDEVEEVVVTGTFIRSSEPVGTNVIGVTQADVAATGATTTAQLLQSIPQLNTFNDLQLPRGAGNTVTVNRPNLRNLPGNTTAGGSTTLVLMDGHRVVGMGVTSTTPDPDVIPPGAIERLEIVPDGGSAVYGSDAVAGVMNFITRRKFDGLQVDGHYGLGDAYHQADGSITGGRDWGSGGFYVSYNYAEHADIFGRDRDYVKQFPGANGLTSLNCNPGTVAVTTGVAPNTVVTNYGLPYAPGAAVANSPHQCDTNDDLTLYPSEHRHSGFGRYTQDLSDALNIDVQAFYTKRETELQSGPYTPQSGKTVTNNANTASFFVPHRTGVETSQNVLFQFGARDAQPQNLDLETWGITPTLTVNLGTSWKLRVLGNYGESTTENHAAIFKDAALTNAINAGLFNPYDPAASNPAAVAAITNNETFGIARQSLKNGRAVLDGDLFTLPGGAVKLAAGVEYIGESWKSQAGEQVPGTEKTGYAGLSLNSATGVSTLIFPAAAALREVDLSRNVKSAFAEVVVPIFGETNAMTGVQELSLSAAARYDDYSDVGDTTNPRFGLNYKPVEWLKLRGAWGKSFNAPSLADAPDADITTLFELSPSLSRNVLGTYPTGSNLQANGGRYPAPAPDQYVFVIRGNSDVITPQEATTTSFGLDFVPTFVEGLSIGVTYWKIDLTGVIGVPPGNLFQQVYRDYPQTVTLAPSAAELNALIAQAGSFGQFGRCDLTTTCTANAYALIDIRKQNLGDFKVDGLDMNASYSRDMGFGSLNFSVNANYELNRTQRSSAGVAEVDLLKANNSRFKMRTVVGAQTGNLLSQVTWNHRAGYDLNPIVGLVPQSKIHSYDVFNLFFRYDMNGEAAFKDLSFTLSADNVFDTDPPSYRGAVVGSASGFQNGATLGRVIQVGVSKKFF